MGQIDEIADRYVEEWAALDPISATVVGITGHDDRLTDLSPEGHAALVDLDRRTLAQLDQVSPADEAERVAKEAMRERLRAQVERYDAGIALSELSVISGALYAIRSTFDLMPTAGEAAAATLTTRMLAVPTTLAQASRALLEAAGQGHVAARHQILEVVAQCETLVAADGNDYWPELAQRVRADSEAAGARLPDSLLDRLETATSQAREATADYGRFLREELAPRGRERQGVGREVYQVASRYHLGASVDLAETYAWGFHELARIEAEMRAVADKIVPGGTVAEAVAALDADPARQITGKEPFRAWMQQLADRALADLHGTHFDIPEPVRVIECRIAPTSDGVVYYTGPSEDFSRPGRMWWSVPAGIESFATWKQVTTVYHEGVPGHHLQIAQTAVRAQVLNRWRRLVCWCAGHGEGWALYAERLMDELGYLDDPGDKLGMLDGQAFRAIRVILDIGMHLELAIPPDNPFDFHPGEIWTPQLGGEFLRDHCQQDEEYRRFELNRYLGWPGQAPAYKVGERIWLQARADAQARQGQDFDLKSFHRAALDLGSLGLDPLRAALARL